MMKDKPAPSVVQVKFNSQQPKKKPPTAQKGKARNMGSGYSRMLLETRVETDLVRFGAEEELADLLPLKERNRKALMLQTILSKFRVRQERSEVDHERMGLEVKRMFVANRLHPHSRKCRDDLHSLEAKKALESRPKSSSLQQVT
jgi:hypothetical protein